MAETGEWVSPRAGQPEPSIGIESIRHKRKRRPAKGRLFIFRASRTAYFFPHTYMMGVMPPPLCTLITWESEDLTTPPVYTPP